MVDETPKTVKKYKNHATATNKINEIKKVFFNLNFINIIVRIQATTIEKDNYKFRMPNIVYFTI